MTMWTIQEFTDSLDSYGARIVKLIAPPPVTPLSTNPALIPQGQSSLNVTVSGVAAGGRGFYDPGPGFGCRLAASIGGGIAINSVVYNNPTSITLNISTVGALTGSKSISVTNPDGQSATGGLLTVGLPGSCSFTLDSTTQSFSSAGGTGNLNVATAGGCAWTAISNDSWITVTSGGGGVGNGTITYSVANNPGGASRNGTMTIGGVVFIVTQNGTGLCNFSIAPTSQNFVVGGGTGSVSVTADAGCAWTATSNAAFITITSGSSGTGNGAVNYSVSANPTTSIRTGTMTIAGLTFTVTQNPVPCSFTILPTSQTFAAGGGTGNVAVTTQTGCVWSASSNDSWITIVSGAGTGSGTVNYSVASNSSINPRSGTMTIAGLTFNVMQNGATCAFTISPVSQSFSAGGGSGSIGITALAGCAWTAVSNDSWISITSGASGSGSGTANYSVSSNTSGAPRSGTLTVAGQTFTVTQASQACTFSITPTSGLFESSGGSAGVSVVAPGGCGWTAVSNSPWITVTSGAGGSGNGTVAYSVAVNGTVDPRVGTLTVAGQTVTVTQSGVTCVTAISPLTASIGAGGETANIAVTAPFNCNWTATSNASWINISANASGSGNKTIKYNVAPNSGPFRTGTVTIRGRLHTVIQAGTGGGPCTFSITPSNQNFGSGGGNSTVSVTSQTGCAWTAISNVPWVTITAGSSGLGSGTVNYSVAANIATSSRSGSMTVAGQTFTVTQDPAASSCTFTILPTSQNFISSGGTGSVSVTTQGGCAWTAVSNAGFVTITSGAAGTGSGTVNYSVSANTGIPRMGSITIAGQTFTVTQDAAPAPCTFSIAPMSQSFASGGGSGSVAVTTQAGCAWTATSNAPWITITSGSSGTDSGGVNYSVATNPSTSSRMGTLTAAGQTFTVTQSGVSSGCSFSISPSSKAFLAAAGASTVNVTVVAGSGCTWTAVSNVPWITVTSGSNGSGNGIVGYSVSANTSGASRTGTMTIAGSIFTVKQQ